MLQKLSHLSGATVVATSTSLVNKSKRVVRESWEMPSHGPRWRSLFDTYAYRPALSTTAVITIFALAAQIEDGLHQLFGAEAVEFRSREQEERTIAVLYGETPITIIIPISGGKIVLTMLPVVLDEEGVSIFIALFRALVNDVVIRF